MSVFENSIIRWVYKVVKGLYLVRILKKIVFFNFIFVMYINPKVYTQNFKSIRPIFSELHCLLCDKCVARTVNFSPFIGHCYAINRRFAFVMRVLGLGLKGTKKFCGIMDMPAFLSQSTYDMIIQNIHS